VVLAGQLEDKKWALEKLLGPALTPEGSATRLKSQEARELTQHRYTPDRWVLCRAMLCCECAHPQLPQHAYAIRDTAEARLLAAQWGMC
jgi:hypothetical protein